MMSMSMSKQKIKIYSKCQCHIQLISRFMALFRHQFLLLPKYLTKFQFKKFISRSQNASSLYECTAKKVIAKNKSKQQQEGPNRKNLDYNNDSYNPYYLIKSGLPLKIDQIIRRSARCFLLPRSYSKLQIRFFVNENDNEISENDEILLNNKYKPELTLNESLAILEELVIREKSNVTSDIEKTNNIFEINNEKSRENFIVDISELLELLKELIFKRKSNSKGAVTLPNTFLAPKNLSITQVRLCSEKPPNDDSKKPCERKDSTKKLEKLCENLSKPSESSDSKEPMVITLESEEDKYRKKLETGTIVLRGDPDYSLVNGVPVEITCWRRARIYQPRKNAMQQGTRNIGHWELSYDTRERWENPLMGWISTGDTVSNVVLQFSSKEEAINYCVNNNMDYYVSESKTKKKFKVRSYGINFHHKNRTRVSTK